MRLFCSVVMFGGPSVGLFGAGVGRGGPASGLGNPGVGLGGRAVGVLGRRVESGTLDKTHCAARVRLKGPRAGLQETKAGRMDKESRAHRSIGRVMGTADGLCPYHEHVPLRGLSINLAPRADLDDQHPQAAILDPVNGALIPGAGPVQPFLAGQLQRAGVPRVLDQLFQGGGQPPPGEVSNRSNCFFAVAVNSIL